MLFIEMSVYVYMAIANEHCQPALMLSCFLLVASFLTLLPTVLSIPLTFYYYHWRIYFVLAALSIAGRVAAIIWVVVINFSTSDQLFLTEDGYVSLVRTSLIFLALQAVLIFEKNKFYRTRRQANEMQVQRLIRV